MNKKDLKIVFMGTPEFAIPSLDILVKNDYNIAAVITSPDKPAGRGKKIQPSPVKQYALKKSLKILQPTNLKSPEFIEELKSVSPNLQVVVAFRVLPEVVWGLPKYGTFNLHASLLPDYRGAAPINWSIINGEESTGVTTFFIEKNIDTGKILFQEKIPIQPDDTAGSMHDKLMELGGQLVLKTVGAIENDNYNKTSQDELIKEKTKIKPAPKIFKEDCQIDWTKNARQIYNFTRGLNPYPTAWTRLINNEKNITLKVYKVNYEKSNQIHSPGKILSDNKTFFKVTVPDGYISIGLLQAEGKKKMNTEEFLRGFQGLSGYKLLVSSNTCFDGYKNTTNLD